MIDLEGTTKKQQAFSRHQSMANISLTCFLQTNKIIIDIKFKSELTRLIKNDGINILLIVILLAVTISMAIFSVQQSA